MNTNIHRNPAQKKTCTSGLLLKNGELKLKNAPGFKKHPLFLIVLLLSCTVFFASCSGGTSSNSSSTAITPIGAQTTCLTVNSPSLVKLTDGNYKLVDEIDNCGSKDAGPLKVTVQIDTERLNLLGPETVPAKGKAVYNTFTGQTSATNKEIHFPSPLPSSTNLTILATINSSVQGEWDGQVTLRT